MLFFAQGRDWLLASVLGQWRAKMIISPIIFRLLWFVGSALAASAFARRLFRVLSFRGIPASASLLATIALIIAF
jgi:hypothetical protein